MLAVLFLLQWSKFEYVFVLVLLLLLLQNKQRQKRDKFFAPLKAPQSKRLARRFIALQFEFANFSRKQTK